MSWKLPHVASMANRLAAQGRLCALLRQIFISTLQDHDLNYDISSMASNARFIADAYEFLSRVHFLVIPSMK